MKYLILIIVFFTTTSIYSQNLGIKAKVDERTELLSIVFRLAGAEEYSWGTLPKYNDDIDNCFGKFRDCDVIKYAKKLRNSKGIMYDKVMSLAIHIEINDLTISLKNNVAPNSLNKRWSEKDTKKFIDYLSVFYNKSDFKTFFNDHKNLYSIAESRFDKNLENINFKWFDEFYGQEPQDNYKVIISMTNGGANYGPKVIDSKGKETKFAILGTVETDSLENPIYPTTIIPTIIHEFNHSYCNHLILDNINEFSSSGKKIYSKVKKQMKSQAYGSYQTMLYESLVRASVIKYLESNDTTENRIEKAIVDEERNSFIWTDMLVDKLSVYENNRDKYKTLESYMPKLVLFFDSIAENFDAYYDEFSLNCPKIISSSIENKSKINPTLTEIIFKFNKPMQNQGYGFSYGKGGKDSFPKIASVVWIDKQTIKLNVTLTNKKEYSMTFYTRAYVSEDGCPMLKGFELEFITQ